MLSQAVQDYLKTIYNLQENGAVSTTEIAKDLNVSGASVTGMLKRLSGMKYVNYHSYKGVTLTAEGERAALDIIRRHRLLELYLKEMLGYSLEKVHEEACRLEHYISEEFGDKIAEQLGNPKYDPHGHPIPSKDGDMPVANEIPLAEVEAGKKVHITRLSDTDPKFLEYMETLGLLPSVLIKVIEKAPFKGPITIIYNDEQKIIGHELAKNVFVEDF